MAKLKDYLNEEDGETSEMEDHYHEFEVDDNGNGKTTKTIDGKDHVHKIIEYVVQETHGHDHDIEFEEDEE